MALSKAGIRNCVAPLGTALTSSQILNLKRFAEKFILMFDGDEAGSQAMMRAIPLLFQAGLHSRVAFLPMGEDPDSLVQNKGAKAITQLIDKAPPAMEWMMVQRLTKVGLQTTERVAAARALIPYIRELPSSLEQQSYLARLAQFLNIEEANLLKLAKKPNEPSSVLSKKDESKNSLERILLELYVKDPHRVSKLLDYEVFQQFEDKELKEIALVLEKQFRDNDDLLLGRLVDLDLGLAKNLVSELALASEQWPKGQEFDKALVDCIHRWKLKKLQRQLKQLTDKIQIAEMESDAALLTKLMAQKNEVAKNLKQLNKA